MLPLPATDVAADSVDVLPKHTVLVPVITANGRAFSVTVTLTQAVVLQVPSARTK